MSDSNKINLLQMQNYFEGQTDSIRTIKDLELSENDYRSLGLKLKSLCFFAGSENDIEDYMLSIVVYSTYSLIYGSEYGNFESIIWMILNKSQYMERMHLRMYKNVFDIYGLSSFGIIEDDLMLCCQRLTARHAGVPNSEKTEYFDLISNHLECNEVKTMYEEIYENLPYRTHFIFSLLDENTRNRILMDSRMLINDVIGGTLNYYELLDKYADLSISMVDRCLMWGENYRQKIRYHIN